MHRILLAVTGLSPQVLTETLYALAVGRGAGGRAWIPDRIVLVTTRSGRDMARRTLLPVGEDRFGRLLREYELPPVHFDEGSIHVLRDAAGVELDDIRDDADNEIAADAVVELIRALTQDPAGELHVSLAGGRKTMGFYAGYGLSLFGRPGDRLSHVLVSEPFEGRPEFFYPTPGDHWITYVDAKGTPQWCNARDARVVLADIPFVPLRASLPDETFREGAGYRDTVRAIRETRPDTARLAYDLERRILLANGHAVPLTGAQLLIHLLATIRYKYATDREQLLRAPVKGAPDADWTRDALATLRRLGDWPDPLAEEIHDFLGPPALPRPLDGERFSPILSMLNKRLKQALGPAAAPFLVRSDGQRRGGARYSLQITPEHIDLEAPPAS